MARLFELENNNLEKKNKVKGIITSIAIHALLLVLFYFLLAVSPPNPPMDGGGVEINFGFMDDGMGDVQPMSTELTPVIPQAVKPIEPEKNTGDKIISQENSDVTINSKKKENNKKKKNTPIAIPTPDKKTEAKNQIAKATFKGWTNNASQGEGDGNKPGDKGQLNGTTDGTAYSGTPGINGGFGGDGIGFKLGNRKMTKRPNLNNPTQETGKITVAITVNNQGKVVEAVYSPVGSNSTNGTLINLAIKASKEALFDVEQSQNSASGTITYFFKVK